jgi:hypothetical protein
MSLGTVSTNDLPLFPLDFIDDPCLRMLILRWGRRLSKRAWMKRNFDVFLAKFPSAVYYPRKMVIRELLALRKPKPERLQLLALRGAKTIFDLYCLDLRQQQLTAPAQSPYAALFGRG